MRRMETAICSSVDGEDAIHARRGDLEGIAADLGNGETVGERGLGGDADWFSFLHRLPKNWRRIPLPPQ